MQVLEKYMKWKPFVKQSLDSLVETETLQILWECWCGAFARCLLNGLLGTCIGEAGFKYWAALTLFLMAVWNIAENSGCLYVRPWGCGPRGSGLLVAQGCVWLVISVLVADPWGAGWLWLWDGRLRCQKQDKCPDRRWPANSWPECPGKDQV